MVYTSRVNPAPQDPICPHCHLPTPHYPCTPPSLPLFAMELTCSSMHRGLHRWWWNGAGLPAGATKFYIVAICFMAHLWQSVQAQQLLRQHRGTIGLCCHMKPWHVLLSHFEACKRGGGAKEEEELTGSQQATMIISCKDWAARKQRLPT